jgi:hypothetical protein
MQQAGADAARFDMVFGVLEMRQFLFPYREDDRRQSGIAAVQKMKLIVEVAMHGSFDGGGANPDCLPAHQGGEQTEPPATPAPERHDAAGPRVSPGHRGEKLGAMNLLVSQHRREGRHDLRIELRRDHDLRRIDADRAELTGMIDLDDARDRQGFGC